MICKPDFNVSTTSYLSPSAIKVSSSSTDANPLNRPVQAHAIGSNVRALPSKLFKILRTFISCLQLFILRAVYRRFNRDLLSSRNAPHLCEWAQAGPL